ncbi:hypothetical protein AWL63_15330 [Sphingomonas panacis]|uniref:Uncharacterized protein n=1 Tax=Sphingomonas panacis TaxID=1560345 RepID=A0A1B3ZCH9_9SPHN|nr:hypothetical protein AWL63_15330 [Sphingomonas panacis]
MGAVLKLSKCAILKRATVLPLFLVSDFKNFILMLAYYEAEVHYSLFKQCVSHSVCGTRSGFHCYIRLKCLRITSILRHHFYNSGSSNAADDGRIADNCF